MTERLSTHLTTPQSPTTTTYEVNPLLLNKEQQDITTFYNVENDVLFLQKYANSLTPKESVYYLKENVLSLLSEFAGKVPYRNITYLLGEKGLAYGDIRLIDMLQYTSDLAGRQSREEQENIGHTWVYHEFEKSYQQARLLKHAAILSPPKDWDYGYLFYYEPEFDPDLGREAVKMHAIKYGEARHEIKNSQTILHRLKPNFFYRTAREFLEFPIFDLDQSANLDTLLQAAGVSKQDVDYSHWFENTVRQDKIISYGMERYIQLAIDFTNSANLLDYDSYDNKLAEMKFLLRGMYNRATKLKEVYEGLVTGQNTLYPANFIFEAANQLINKAMPIQAFTAYADKPAVVIGGGSCPPVSNKNSSGFMSSYQLSEGLSKGISIESLISKGLTNNDKEEDSDEFGPLEFVCPHSDCKKVNRRPAHKRIPICQHCGKDVKCD